MAPTFNDSLDEVLALLGTAEHPPALKVGLGSRQEQPAAENEILVGVGSWMLAGKPVQHAGICLNRKGLKAAFGLAGDPPSDTDAVLDPPPALAGHWASWAERFTSLADLAARTRITVEDAAPDTALALLTFLARCRGADLDGLPASWREACRSWEQEGNADDAFQSWACLVSALAHVEFGRADLPRTTLEEAAAAALTRAVRLTARLIRNGCDPERVPALNADRDYRDARAALDYEQRQHEETTLPRGMHVQLAVPIHVGKGRRLPIDAWFGVVVELTGVQKVFLRNDRTTTHYKRGYSLMGTHRRGLEGTGDDMTVSVDTRTGIWLEELWRELERLENERWAGRRPNGQQRMIKSYAAGEGYDQPWWDSEGRYTLIGAPRRIEATGELGSRLRWDEVVDACWRLYKPTNGLYFLDWTKAAKSADKSGPVPVAIEACAPFAVPEGSFAVTKKLYGVQWAKSGTPSTSAEDPAREINLSPAVLRIFAAVIARKDSRAPVGIEGLPPIETIDCQSIPGGYAIVTPDGALLLDDRRSRSITEHERTGYQKVFWAGCRLLNELEQVQRKLKPAQEQFRTIAGGIHHLKPFYTLQRELADIGAGISAAASDWRAAAGREPGDTLHKAIDKAWRLTPLIQEAKERAGDLDKAVEKLVAARTQLLVRNLSWWGLPFFIAGGLLLALRDPLTTIQAGCWPPPIQFLPLGIYLALAFVIALLFRFVWIRRK